MARNGLDLKMSFPSDAELQQLFATVPKLNHYKVLDKAVDAATGPVVKRARQLAPNSSKTGTSKKRSKNQFEKADWNYPLWKTIKRVIRKYAVNAVGVIGPEWPKGNKAYFNTSPKGNKGHLWGHEGKAYPTRKGGVHVAGPPKPRIQVRNWIVQAMDETKSQQLEAMKASVIKSLEQVMRG